MSGSQVGGLTTLEFFRLLDTGDTAGDRIIGEVHKYIYSDIYIGIIIIIVMFCCNKINK